jgi:hypothetical protein
MDLATSSTAAEDARLERSEANEVDASSPLIWLKRTRAPPSRL